MYHLVAMNSETISLSTLIRVLCEHVRTSPARLKTELCHIHLPMLADHQMIEYDARSETIRYRKIDRIESIVELTRFYEEL